MLKDELAKECADLKSKLLDFEQKSRNDEKEIKDLRLKQEQLQVRS